MPRSLGSRVSLARGVALATAALLGLATHRAAADCRDEQVKTFFKSKTNLGTLTSLSEWKPGEGGAGARFCVATIDSDVYVVKYFDQPAQCATEVQGYAAERVRQVEILRARDESKVNGNNVPPLPPIVSRIFARYVGSDGDSRELCTRVRAERCPITDGRAPWANDGLLCNACAILLE